MKSVTVEELKERLDEVIEEVKQGETVAIMRDGVQLAKLAGAHSTAQRGKRFPFRDLHFTSIGPDLGAAGRLPGDDMECV